MAKKAGGLKAANGRRNMRTMKHRKPGYAPRIVKGRRPKQEDMVVTVCDVKYPLV